ncbi:hypothetical protein VB773_00090 [Haloarculaceae archaeon H-GB2-1]|nr:hypothetical protein [Haloarculaceae archaeon H-GB2-1]
MLREVAETATGDELDYRPNRGHDSRGSFYRRQNDYDWTRSPDVAPGRRFGETLAQQERRRGREAEQARHAETARDAHEADLNRDAASRQCTTAETSTADGFEPDPDPRATMAQATLATVNRAAKSVSDRTGVSRAAAGRLVANGVRDGRSQCESVFDALDTVREARAAPVPIAEVNPNAYETTIEGRVRHLVDDPATANQYQVAFVEDDAGTAAKVTLWAKSMHGTMVRTLREGDRVRISSGKPGQYEGLTTVSVTSDSMISVIERGDGPAPTGEGRYSFGSTGDSQSRAPGRPTPTHTSGSTPWTWTGLFGSRWAESSVGPVW